MQRLSHVTIAETALFESAVASFLDEEELDELKNYLAVRPEAGAVIPGGGGIRKLRWAASGRGKRGGARVIYYFYDTDHPLYLLDAYKKNQQVRLSADDKKVLRTIAKALREEFRQGETNDESD